MSHHKLAPQPSNNCLRSKSSALPRANAASTLTPTPAPILSRASSSWRKGGVLGSSPTPVTMPPFASRANRCTFAAQRRRRGESKTRVGATSNVERDGAAEQIVRRPSERRCGRRGKRLASFPGAPPMPPAQPKAARNGASPTRSAIAQSRNRRQRAVHCQSRISGISSP